MAACRGIAQPSSTARNEIAVRTPGFAKVPTARCLASRTQNAANATRTPVLILRAAGLILSTVQQKPAKAAHGAGVTSFVRLARPRAMDKANCVSLLGGTSRSALMSARAMMTALVGTSAGRANQTTALILPAPNQVDHQAPSPALGPPAAHWQVRAPQPLLCPAHPQMAVVALGMMVVSAHQ